MKTIKTEMVDPYDIDGTLVLHQDPDTIPEDEKVVIYDEISKKLILLRKNKPMIRLLKESRHRGAFVIAWSKNGYQWAEDVIRALGLTEYVNVVMTKPAVYFDDKPIQEWMPYRVFIGPNENYKPTINKGEN